MSFTEIEMDNFSAAIESLKKYRRSDVERIRKGSLDALYTDLLPNNSLLKKCLLDNTTFLIGRKGTGKSTIFLKIESELRNRRDYMPCYLDVKEIFESSGTNIVMPEHLKNDFSLEEIGIYLLQRQFIMEILNRIKKEINAEEPIIRKKIKDILNSQKKKKVTQQLDELLKKLADDEVRNEIELTTLKQVKKRNIEVNSTEESLSSLEGFPTYNVEFKPGIISANVGNASKKENSRNTTVASGNYFDFAEIFLKIFRISGIITQIKDVLSVLKIKHLFILLDDLSEIDDDAMRTFIDTIVMPLNNWSDEFVKFKIAVYPGRVHYGKIDPSKVDTVNLDFYNLYSEFNRNKMEEEAVGFTKRLLEKRINFFCESPVEKYFDTTRTTMADYYKLLFFVSMNVPRILGYILSYCYQAKTIHNKKITESDIKSATERYFKEKIEPFFGKTTYSLSSMDEKINVMQLKGLRDSIVNELVDIRKEIPYISITNQQFDKKSPCSSHFYISSEFEEYLKTLELNHFISKYGEMADKDAKPISIFCINYGMARQNKIVWGKPKGSVKYFTQRQFDFDLVIKNFISSSETIECKECDVIFTDIDKIEAMEKYNKGKCFECGGLITKSNILSSEKKEIIDDGDRRKLPKDQLDVLLELIIKEDFMFARDLSEITDYPSKSVMWKCKKLVNIGLVESEHDGQLLKYRSTEKAKMNYKVLLA